MGSQQIALQSQNDNQGLVVEVAQLRQIVAHLQAEIGKLQTHQKFQYHAFEELQRLVDVGNMKILASYCPCLRKGHCSPSASVLELEGPTDALTVNRSISDMEIQSTDAGSLQVINSVAMNALNVNSPSTSSAILPAPLNEEIPVITIEDEEDDDEPVILSSTITTTMPMVRRDCKMTNNVLPCSDVREDARDDIIQDVEDDQTTEGSDSPRLALDSSSQNDSDGGQHENDEDSFEDRMSLEEDQFTETTDVLSQTINDDSDYDDQNDDQSDTMTDISSAQTIDSDIEDEQQQSTDEQSSSDDEICTRLRPRKQPAKTIISNYNLRSVTLKNVSYKNVQNKSAKKMKRNPTLFQCHLCDKSYKREGDLKNHIAFHKTGNSCSQCGKEFSAPHTLARHMNRCS